MGHHVNNKDAEITVDGRIISVANNGEAIVFEIPLGFFKIVAIANIPGEGEDSAPVYIKIRRKDSGPGNNKPRFNRNQRNDSDQSQSD